MWYIRLSNVSTGRCSNPGAILTIPERYLPDDGVSEKGDGLAERPVFEVFGSGIATGNVLSALEDFSPSVNGKKDVGGS